MTIPSDIIVIYIDETICQAVYFVDGSLYELVDSQSSPIMPSIVTVLPDNIIVANKHCQVQYPRNTISRCFKLLGRVLSPEELAYENLRSSVPLEMRENGKVIYHLRNAKQLEWSVEDVICTIVRFLINSCEEIMNIDIHNCILVIPDDFNEKEYMCYKSVVEKTGVHVESSIKRSVCIGYSLLESRITPCDAHFENCNLVLYQLCDSCLQCSVVCFENETPCFVAGITDVFVSLDVFIRKIEAAFIQMFFLQNDFDLYASSEGSEARMKEVSKVQKDIRDWLLLIDDLSEISIEVPSLARRVIYKKKKQIEEFLTIDKFEITKILRDSIQRIASTIRLVVQKAGRSIDDIYKIIPIGPSSNMCLIQSEIKRQFGDLFYFPGYLSISKGAGYSYLLQICFVCFNPIQS